MCYVPYGLLHQDKVRAADEGLHYAPLSLGPAVIGGTKCGGLANSVGYGAARLNGHNVPFLLNHLLRMSYW